MCDSLKQYTSFENIINDLKVGDHILVKDYTHKTPFEAIVNKKKGDDVYLNLYNNDSAKIIANMALNETDDTEYLNNVIKSQNSLKMLEKDLTIYINPSRLLSVNYENNDIDFGWEDTTLEYIKCLKQVTVKGLIDLYNILPKNFTQDKEKIQSVMILLQTEDKQNKIITELLKYGQNLKINIFPTIELAPDFLEHKYNNKISFDDLKETSKLSNKNTHIINNKFYYNLVPTMSNFNFVFHNFNNINEASENHKKHSLYIKNFTNTIYTTMINNKKTDLQRLEPIVGDSKHEYDRKENEIKQLKNNILKDAKSHASTDHNYQNVLKEQDNEKNYINKAKEHLQSLQSLKIPINSLLDKNINLLSDQTYIQPIKIVSKLKSTNLLNETTISGHIVNILADPKNKIAYYIDSDSDGSTTMITHDPFSGKPVFVSMKSFFNQLKIKGINNLINIKEMMEFCPYVSGTNYRGAQNLNKDFQCQTWYIYYVTMFILNPHIPKGLIVKLINNNYSERLAQFTNYIYEHYITRKSAYNCSIM